MKFRRFYIYLYSSPSVSRIGPLVEFVNPEWIKQKRLSEDRQSLHKLILPGKVRCFFFDICNKFFTRSDQMFREFFTFTVFYTVWIVMFS